MHAQTAIIENGFVHLPEHAPWLAEIPRRADDISERQTRRPGRLDRADARWFKGAAREPGILCYYRMLAQTSDAADPV
jgi:hypothetical protein